MLGGAGGGVGGWGEVKSHREVREHQRTKGFCFPLSPDLPLTAAYSFSVWLSKWFMEQRLLTDDAYVPKRDTESEKAYKGRTRENRTLSENKAAQ